MPKLHSREDVIIFKKLSFKTHQHVVAYMYAHARLNQVNTQGPHWKQAPGASCAMLFTIIVNRFANLLIKYSINQNPSLALLPPCSFFFTDMQFHTRVHPHTCSHLPTQLLL